jgi:hypothetical protein
MSKERPEYYDDGSLSPPIEKIITLRRFVRTIETAHENGVALLLASELVLSLQAHYEEYGAITAAELEGLIFEAASVLIKKTPRRDQ